jgi:hypothetical protein
MNLARELTILEIGAEGGAITVVCRLGIGGTPEYSVRLRDQALLFLSQDEADHEINTATEWSSNWDHVVKSLGRWPWPMLVPLTVRLDYAARVLAAVVAYRDRGERPVRPEAVRRWSKACGVKD